MLTQHSQQYLFINKIGFAQNVKKQDEEKNVLK